MHLVREPVTVEGSSVAPSVLSFSTNVIVKELADVISSIGPKDLAMTILGAIHVEAFVSCLVRPRLCPVSMLFIFLPFSFIDASIIVGVLAVAVSFVIEPITKVDIAIAVNQAPNAIKFSVQPLAFIQRTIRESLAALASFLLEIMCPLSDVNRATCHPERTFSNNIPSSIPGETRNMIPFMILENFLYSFVEKQFVFGYVVVKLSKLTIKIINMLDNLLKSFPLSEAAEESLDFDNLGYTWLVTVHTK